MKNELIALEPCSAHGEVRLAGSKSITNRAYIMAALAEGKSSLKNISLSDDSRVLLSALKQLGVQIEINGDSCEIFPTKLIKKAKINIGAAGTAARFLTALLATIEDSEYELTGDERIKERPIGELVQALNKLGADISYLAKEGSLPLLIRGKKINGGTILINSHVSSQFITALLLIAPLLQDGLVLELQGEPVSKSYIDITIYGMSQFGIEVINDNYHVLTVKAGQVYKGTELFIEGDASGASYFWGVAALSAGAVKVRNIDIRSVQGDVHFAELLGEMGCSVVHGRDSLGSWISVIGGNNLYAIQADMSSMPDTAQTLAVVASVAQGISKISGLSTLRYKETDRISALLNEFKSLGISAEYTGEFLVIEGGNPEAAWIKTYNDHRMAMSFAMLGARVENIVISDPAVVSKSFPTFWQEMKKVGVWFG